MIHLRGLFIGMISGLFVGVISPPVSAGVSGIYWADAGFFRTPEDPVGLDVHTHRISRFESSSGTSQAIRLTGSDTAPAALVLDSSAGKIYWLDEASQNFYRSDRDGGGLELLLGGQFNPERPVEPLVRFYRGMARDAVHRDIYWGDYFDVHRWNPSMPGVIETFYSTSDKITDLAIDSAGEYGYLLIHGISGGGSSGRIERIQIDTRQSTTVAAFEVDIIGLDHPLSIAIDDHHGRLYWGMGSGRIYRSDLDGTQVELLLDMAGGINAIQIDGVSNALYFTNGLAIYQANLDGGDLLALLLRTDSDGVLFDARSLALDPNPIPLPGAAWAGLGLLGALALRRRRR